MRHIAGLGKRQGENVNYDTKLVYCTNCIHFELEKVWQKDEDMWDYVPTCVYESECDILNPEHSVPFPLRPFYLGHDEVRTTSKM